MFFDILVFTDGILIWTS